MIITCPHCRTKYQVTYEAIGSAGRKVQCAQCRQAWDARPSPESDDGESDVLFDDMAEDALDELIATEEASVLAEKAVTKPVIEPVRQKAPDAAEQRKRQAAFSRRQNAMSSRLPLARLRRGARSAGVVLLAGILAFGYFGRVALVERYPDLAGLYQAIGLGVNVVGLDFDGLESLRTLSGGKDVLLVSAQIVGRDRQPVAVPPVVVSLLDQSGHAVYEWSVEPRVSDLMAGERATFDTRLSLPPGEAVRVRLSFAGDARSQNNPGAAPAISNSPQNSDQNAPAAAASEL
jgi:predicted Zn finger-like uncharacterized protein